MTIQEEIKQFRKKYNRILIRMLPHLGDRWRLESLEQFFLDRLQKVREAKRERVLEIIGIMEDEAQFDIHHEEYEEGYNQALSDLREKLVEL